MHIYSAIPAEQRGKDKGMHKKSSSSLSQECEENQSNCALSKGIFQGKLSSHITQTKTESNLQE